jgi:hypothetical protein
MHLIMLFDFDIWPTFSAGNPSIFRVTFLLHEYSVIKCSRLLHNTEITTTIG